MSDLYRKNDDGEFELVGMEFTGFPANGVWVVEDGRRQCIYQFKEPVPAIPTPALLSYLVLQAELTTEIRKAWEADNLSTADIARIACEFFAVKAGGMKFEDGILEY